MGTADFDGIHPVVRPLLGRFVQVGQVARVRGTVAAGAVGGVCVFSGREELAILFQRIGVLVVAGTSSLAVPFTVEKAVQIVRVSVLVKACRLVACWRATGALRNGRAKRRPLLMLLLTSGQAVQVARVAQVVIVAVVQIGLVVAVVG